MLLANKPIGTIGYLGGQPALLEEFTWSLAQMIQFNSEALCGAGEYVHLAHTKASFHSFARNSLVDAALGDWLLMLDTDHQFGPDLCLRLLDRLNVYQADVIVGLYQHRQHPHVPVLYMKNEQDLYAPLGAWGNVADVLTIDSAGAGCLMAKRSVFDRIRSELKEGPFDISYPLGEDHSFFKRCAKLKLKVLCDPRIECHHLQVKPITLNDYDKEAVSLAEPQEVVGYKVAAGVE